MPAWGAWAAWPGVAQRGRRGGVAAWAARGSARWRGPAWRCGPARRGARSVHRRVGRHPRHQRVAAALAGQDVGPQPARVAREGVLEPGRFQDPVSALELAVELTRPPAGVAEERAAGFDADGELLGRGAGAQYADVVERDQGRIRGVP